MDSLHAGKDVYCEKPLTYSVAEGLEIVRAARDGARIVQVGSQGVSSSLQQKARQIIRSGWLGTTTTVRGFCNRNSVNGAWIYPFPPDASAKTANWEMFLGPAPNRPFSLERFFRWRCYQDYSGGIASDLLVHLCTTIHYLLDVPAPTRVTAFGERYRWGFGRDVPDTVNAILEYPRGFVVNLSATLNNRNGPETGLHFLGTEGTLKLDNHGLEFEPEEPVEDNRWIVRSWPKAMEDAYYKRPEVILTEVGPSGEKKEEEEDREKAEREKEDEQELRNPEKAHHFKPEGPDPTVAHLGHFFESLRTRQPYWEDATAGHRAAACAHMINLSIKEKRMVEWDFQKDEIKS
jgi:predicted dehydrogenase